MRIRWRGLELPTRVERDKETSAPTYGKFMVEPFERGFGTTVGNSLRRILLSSLEGAAVTDVTIKGIDHEFTMLQGVVQDVTEIILNVKSLIVSLDADQPKTMRVSVKGKAGESVEVRADQIEADAAIEIISKDILLATLTDDVEFEMEMTVAKGRGYLTADENKLDEEDQIIGVIPVDSVHSPVTRVRYRVEDTRVGQRVNYDRLIMEIWTNGTVTPEMALVEAAKILRKHLNAFIQYFEIGTGIGMDKEDPAAQAVEAGGDDVERSVMMMPISELELSVRATNCLTMAEVTTVGELTKWDEPSLLKLRAFGNTSMREVKRKLADLGLALMPSSEPSDISGDTAFPGQPYDAGIPTGLVGSTPVTPIDSGSYGTVPPPSAHDALSMGTPHSGSALPRIDSGLAPLDSGSKALDSGTGFPSENNVVFPEDVGVLPNDIVAPPPEEGNAAAPAEEEQKTENEVGVPPGEDLG